MVNWCCETALTKASLTENQSMKFLLYVWEMSKMWRKRHQTNSKNKGQRKHRLQEKTPAWFLSGKPTWREQKEKPAIWWCGAVPWYRKTAKKNKCLMFLKSMRADLHRPLSSPIRGFWIAMYLSNSPKSFHVILSSRWSYKVEVLTSQSR